MSKYSISWDNKKPRYLKRYILSVSASLYYVKMNKTRIYTENKLLAPDGRLQNSCKLTAHRSFTLRTFLYKETCSQKNFWIVYIISLLFFVWSLGYVRIYQSFYTKYEEIWELYNILKLKLCTQTLQFTL